jgi:hypothetical protein
MQCVAVITEWEKRIKTVELESFTNNVYVSFFWYPKFIMMSWKNFRIACNGNGLNIYFSEQYEISSTSTVNVYYWFLYYKQHTQCILITVKETHSHHLVLLLLSGIEPMPHRLSSRDGWVDKIIVDSSGFSGTWYTIEDELFCLEHDGHVHFSSISWLLAVTSTFPTSVSLSSQSKQINILHTQIKHP